VDRLGTVVVLGFSLRVGCMNKTERTTIIMMITPATTTLVLTCHHRTPKRPTEAIVRLKKFVDVNAMDGRI